MEMTDALCAIVDELRNSNAINAKLMRILMQDKTEGGKLPKFINKEQAADLIGITPEYLMRTRKTRNLGMTANGKFIREEVMLHVLSTYDGNKHRHDSLLSSVEQSLSSL